MKTLIPVLALFGLISCGSRDKLEFKGLPMNHAAVAQIIEIYRATAPEFGRDASAPLDLTITGMPGPNCDEKQCLFGEDAPATDWPIARDIWTHQEIKIVLFDLFDDTGPTDSIADTPFIHELTHVFFDDKDHHDAKLWCGFLFYGEPCDAVSLSMAVRAKAKAQQPGDP
jgi:hypothetical protein